MNRFTDQDQHAQYERRVRLQDAEDLRRDRRLEALFRLVMLGFFIAGVVGLLTGQPIEGIG